MMKDMILAGALTVARSKGFKAVTREAVAAECNVASATVSYHWETIAKLQNAVVRHAIESDDAKLLAGALKVDHYLALKAPESLRQRAARLICG